MAFLFWSKSSWEFSFMPRGSHSYSDATNTGRAHNICRPTLATMSSTSYILSVSRLSYCYSWGSCRNADPEWACPGWARDASSQAMPVLWALDHTYKQHQYPTSPLFDPLAQERIFKKCIEYLLIAKCFPNPPIQSVKWPWGGKYSYSYFTGEKKTGSEKTTYPESYKGRGKIWSSNPNPASLGSF